MAKETKKTNPHQRVSNQFSKAQRQHRVLKKVKASRKKSLAPGFGPLVGQSKQGASHAWGLVKNSSHRYNK